MHVELPASFEAFSEARRNGFLKAKAVKEHGGRIAGTFCTFTPNEVFDAAGIHTVSLCGTSEETIPAAESDLPKNLCPLIKSSYGFALTDKCPYTYFSDLIVGETTCDGKKKMYELLGRLKRVYVMQLPQNADHPQALALWTEEIRALIQRLRSEFGAAVSDEDLRQACKHRNRQRRARVALMELQKQTPPPAFFKDLYKVLDSLNFSFDQESSTQAVEAMTQKLQREYDEGARPVSAAHKRILITGCPITGVLEKTVGTIESNGGVVVCMENCGGIKPARHMVDPQAEDIVQAIAERYLEIGCAVMSPNRRRMEMIRQLVEEFQPEGIVDVILQACHPYSVERFEMRALAKEMGIPYLPVETDFSFADAGQLTTRLSAFIEML